MSTRTEKDSLGSVKVPSSAYYGAFTQRALQNFEISGISAHPLFITALGTVKLAAARVNTKLKVLSKREGNAIQKAAEEVMNGMFDSEFPLDVFQAGAGTPFNMNANEVIANRANETLKAKKGSYKFVHPNDHVNAGQSSNNFVPTVTRVACLWFLEDFVLEARALEKEFTKKAHTYKNAIKLGRTHLQDAVPVRWGQVFDSYVVALQKARTALENTRTELSEISLGGTAIGTGLNAHPRFQKDVARELSNISGLKLRAAKSGVEKTWNHHAFLQLAHALSGYAIVLNKISADFQLLSAQPFSELQLPEVEPGSSIMPGKVNPSIPEAVTQVCYHVRGAAHTVELAVADSNLELNTNIPVTAFELLLSFEVLEGVLRTFRENCVKGLRVNTVKSRAFVDSNPILVTALNSKIGYAKGAELVKKSQKTGTSILDLVVAEKLLTRKEAAKLLDPKRMT